VDVGVFKDALQLIAAGFLDGRQHDQNARDFLEEF
jgi:hypothetical protein